MTQDAKINIGLGQGENTDSFSEVPGVSATSNVVPAPDGKSLFNRNGFVKHGQLRPVLTGDNAGRIAYSRITNPPNLTDGHVLLLGVNTAQNNKIVAGILARPRGNIDGDSNVSFVQFGSASYTVDPGETVTATVLRTGALDRDITVNYATVNGSATSGTHFTSASGTLSFGRGETSKTFNVTTIDVGAVGNKAFSLVLSAPTGGAVITSPNPASVLIDYDADMSPVFFTGSGSDLNLSLVSYSPSTDTVVQKTFAASDYPPASYPPTSTIFRPSDSRIAITASDGDDLSVLIFNYDNILNSGSTQTEVTELTATLNNGLGGCDWYQQKMNSNGILYWMDIFSNTECLIRRFDLVNGTTLSSITVNFSLIGGYTTNNFYLLGIDASGYLICGHEQITGGNTYRFKVYRVDATDGSVDGSHTFTPTDFGMNATGEGFSIYAATAGSGTNDAVVFHQSNRTRLVRLDNWTAGAATATTVSTGLDASDVLIPQFGVFGNVAWAVNGDDLIKYTNVLSGSFARSTVGTTALFYTGNVSLVGLPVPAMRISDTVAVIANNDGTNLLQTINLSTGAVTTETGSSVGTAQRKPSWSGNRWLETNCQGAM